MTIEQKEELKIAISNKSIINVYLHGSRVYGCANENSDWDFIIITNETVKMPQWADCTFYSKEEWNRMAEENDCDFIECIFLPQEMKFKETYIPKFEIKREKIRSNFSQKSSNSFVKCKKKLTVEKDYNPYVGKKSLFHSLRLIQFGIQILEYGKIVDYSSANEYYDDIVKSDIIDWTYFKNKYQSIYNHYKSEFRKYDIGNQ